MQTYKKKPTDLLTTSIYSTKTDVFTSLAISAEPLSILGQESNNVYFTPYLSHKVQESTNKMRHTGQMVRPYRFIRTGEPFQSYRGTIRSGSAPVCHVGYI